MWCVPFSGTVGLFNKLQTQKKKRNLRTSIEYAGGARHTIQGGSVHYEAWSQPHSERTVLTKPKILCVPIVWLRVEV